MLFMGSDVKLTYRTRSQPTLPAVTCQHLPLIEETLRHRLIRARLVKSLREYPARLVTHEEVATGVGVSPSAVSQWEDGKKRPSRDNIPKVAAFYGVAKTWLEYGEGPMLLAPLAVEGVAPATPTPSRDPAEIPTPDLHSRATRKYQARIPQPGRPEGGRGKRRGKSA